MFAGSQLLFVEDSIKLHMAMSNKKKANHMQI